MPKKRLTGIVVSNKMDKTVVVRVERLKMHPYFKRLYKVHKKFKAHDEKNKCKVGDLVIIEECRPLSKEKRWRVVEIIQQAEELGKEKEEVSVERQISKKK